MICECLDRYILLPADKPGWQWTVMGLVAHSFAPGLLCWILARIKPGTCSYVGLPQTGRQPESVLAQVS